MNNKKVIGSAQTRKDGVLLQHGSIILKFDVEKLFSIIKMQDLNMKDKLIKFTSKKATGIEDELNKKVDALKLEEDIILGIREHFGVDFYEDELSEYEKQLAESLYQKYISEGWNNKR